MAKDYKTIEYTQHTKHLKLSLDMHQYTHKAIYYINNTANLGYMTVYITALYIKLYIV